MIVTLLLVPSHAQFPVLNYNSSFEDWFGDFPNDWTIIYDDSALPLVIYKSSDSYTGDYSLGINASGSSFSFVEIKQNVTLYNIAKYDIGSRLKGDLIEDEEFYYIWRFFDSNDQEIGDSFSGSLVARENGSIDSFLGLSSSFTPDNNTRKIEITLRMKLVGAKMLIDDFKLEYDDPSTISSHEISYSTSETYLTSNTTDIETSINNSSSLQGGSSQDNSTQDSSETESGFLSFSQFSSVLMIVVSIPILSRYIRK